MAKIASEMEIKLAWHNHDIEFQETGKECPFEYFMKHTDQRLVWCEMDTYWVAKSGADPSTILRRYAGRYLAIHVKDMADDDSQSLTCVGEGVLDFAPILAEAVSQDIEHFIVERERVEDGMKCLEASSRYLQSLFT
jgi:sugar phosphate isomerase/epimerase